MKWKLWWQVIIYGAQQGRTKCLTPCWGQFVQRASSSHVCWFSPVDPIYPLHQLQTDSFHQFPWLAQRLSPVLLLLLNKWAQIQSVHILLCLWLRSSTTARFPRARHLTPIAAKQLQNPKETPQVINKVSNKQPEIVEFIHCNSLYYN